MAVVRRRKDCPVCKKEGLLKLSNHLTMVHNITGKKRKTLCCQAKSFPPVTKKGSSTLVVLVSNLYSGVACCMLHRLMLFDK